ncbi:hypothetical protein BJ944DRAFT_168105 [Cunninghamella echinulata]|nr:hypothetical protein BJ944DRAFT_168105 [Cunninghamella echinulata]
MSIQEKYPDYVSTPQPDHIEILTLFVTTIGITLMGVFFGMKTYYIQVHGLTYAKGLVVLLIVFSWSYIISGTFIILTNNANPTSCNAEDWLCAAFYGSTKAIIYFWLVERVWLVKVDKTTRWNSKMYRFLIIIVIPYSSIHCFLIYYRKIEVTSDGTCYIILIFLIATIMLVYDFVINLLLTVLFLKPLFKISKNRTIVRRRKSRLTKLAYRSLIASIIALFASFTNVLFFIILHGYERGVICQLGCDLDMIVNVVAINWVTSPTSSSSTTTTPFQSKSLKTITVISETPGGEDLLINPFIPSTSNSGHLLEHDRY